MKGNVNQQIMAEASGESTIGLDLGDRWSRYCVIDCRGAVTREDRVRTNPEVLEETFRAVLTSKIIIEAGTHSPWVLLRWSRFCSPQAYTSSCSTVPT